MELDERITVVPYDARWPILFEEEKAKLAKVFADCDAVFEHFGSTAVPGMAAKPIVDILVGVRSLELHGETVDRLAELGYEGYGEAGVPGRLHFRKRRERLLNLAVVLRDGDHWTNNLLIRDFLRSSPEIARAYEEHKMAAIFLLNDGSHVLEAGDGEVVRQLFLPPLLRVCHLGYARTGRLGRLPSTPTTTLRSRSAQGAHREDQGTVQAARDARRGRRPGDPDRQP